MRYTLCIFVYCLGSQSLHSQNLILNSSFEQHLEPYCDGWYTNCGHELTCDTLGDCSTLIYEDSPGDSLVDKWCLLIYGNGWPFENHVDYYVTGKAGTFIYQLKFWMNTLHFLGQGQLGIIQHGKYLAQDSIMDVSKPWKEYILVDTLTTTAADTIAVRLAAGIGDFCICDVYFELVELEVLDSLPTAVEPVSNQEEISIFPNPVQDKLQIITKTPSPLVITILNSQGQIVLKQESNDNKASLDMTSLPPGIYFYSIVEMKNKRIMRSGKFVKT
jgi:hypothetical protein